MNFDRRLIDYGESLDYEPPDAATSFMVWARSDIAAGNLAPGVVNELTDYGGTPPAWRQIGGYDIAGAAFVEADDGPTVKSLDTLAPVEGLDDALSADGFSVTWGTLTRIADGLGSEILMVTAYDNGRLIGRTVYRIPAPSSTDAAVIAAQERQQLQSLLNARDRAAGNAGIVKRQDSEGGAEEFESLAVLDRRIAEVRARIAWFQEAERGNPLPRLEAW